MTQKWGPGVGWSFWFNCETELSSEIPQKIFQQTNPDEHCRCLFSIWNALSYLYKLVITFTNNPPSPLSVSCILLFQSHIPHILMNLAFPLFSWWSNEACFSWLAFIKYFSYFLHVLPKFVSRPSDLLPLTTLTQPDSPNISLISLLAFFLKTTSLTVTPRNFWNI